MQIEHSNGSKDGRMSPLASIFLFTRWWAHDHLPFWNHVGTASHGAPERPLTGHPHC